MLTEHTDLDNFIASLNLDYSVEFVPQSKSDEPDQERINWAVAVAYKNIKLETPYSQGIGHIPYGLSNMRRTLDVDAAIKDTCERGKVWRDPHHRVVPQKIRPPILRDVLCCLVLDADAIDYPHYEDWAECLGYDTDSRKGEAIYRKCLEHGLTLRAMLGEDILAKLRDRFADY